MKQTMKVCDRCQKQLILETEIWKKMEWANGKHFQIRHKNCGGSYISTVSELIQKVTES